MSISSNISEKLETMTLEQSIKVSLKDIQDYEKESGKKVGEMSFLEKLELFKRIAERDKIESNEKNTTYKITETFVTTDPVIENKRRRHIETKREIIEFLQNIAGLIISITGVHYAKLNPNDIFSFIQGGFVTFAGMFIATNTHTPIKDNDTDYNPNDIEYNTGDSQSIKEGRSL